MGWSWLVLAIGAILSSHGAVAQDNEDIQIHTLLCRGVNASFRHVEIQAQNLSSICPEGVQLVLVNRGKSNQTENRKVTLYHSDMCILEPSSVPLTGGANITGLAVGEKREIDISGWQLTLHPKCGLSCIMAVVSRKGVNTTYRSFSVMKKCNTSGVDLRIVPNISPPDTDVKIHVHHGISIGEAFSRIPATPNFTIKLVIDNVGSKDLPAFSSWTPITVAAYFTKSLKSLSNLGCTEKSDAKLPYPDFKVTDTLVDGGIQLFKGVLKANGGSWVITMEDMKNFTVNFTKPGSCAICGEGYIVALVDPFFFVDDPNRCNNYAVAKAVIDCGKGKGEQKDKTKQDNILVVPDPSANGHNAMIKYCKGSNSVKTYSTSILFHNRSNIYWQRTEEQAVTSMGFGQAILLYELINRQVAARGRGLVVKVVDQQERWEQSQPYQVPYISKSRTKRSIKDEISKISQLFASIDWKDPDAQTKFRKRLADFEGSSQLKEKLLQIAIGIPFVGNSSTVGQVYEVGDSSSGRCPVWSSTVAGIFKKFYQDYIQFANFQHFSSALNADGDVNMAPMLLRQMVKAGLWNVGLTRIKAFMVSSGSFPTVPYLSQIKNYVDPVLAGKCPKFDPFKPDNVFPVFWTAQNGKVYIGLRGLIFPNKVYWRVVGLLKCDKCKG